MVLNTKQIKPLVSLGVYVDLPPYPFLIVGAVDVMREKRLSTDEERTSSCSESLARLLYC